MYTGYKYLREGGYQVSARYLHWKALQKRFAFSSEEDMPALNQICIARTEATNAKFAIQMVKSFRIR